MPITKSAKKALRQSKKRRARNLKQMDAMKKELKKFKKFVVAKNKTDALKTLPQVYKSLDKAVKNHLIARNKVARLKSHLTKAVNKI